MNDCIWCIRGFQQVCGHITNEKTPTGVDESTPISEVGKDGPTMVRGPYKTESSLKDQQSTGRKRAAVLYPLDSSALCEWAYKTSAGGGKHPIKGCAFRNNSPGLQQHRHHGPDKNTLNNEPGNVHRICTSCHNTWHAANDADYIPGQIQAQSEGD